MDYQEINKCIEILKKKSNWFSSKDNYDEKIKCLETFRIKGTPSNIHFLFDFLKNENIIIQEKTAKVIITLYRQLKSPNDLYESLKFLNIEKDDMAYYRATFDPSTYLHLLGIASMNRSGYVREKAIQLLSETRNPEAIKFILPRLGDWVAPVREKAEKSIQSFLTPDFINSFLRNLPLIDWLLQVQRTDLIKIHSEIINLVFSTELTDDFYGNLKSFDDKTRLIYFRNYLKSKALTKETANLIFKDKNYLIRGELLKYISKLDITIQKEFLIKFLQDRSSKVRVNALYISGHFSPDLDDIIINLLYDESASVREQARYLLKDKQIDFANLYRQKINTSEKLIGSILGLSEVGTKEDLPLFEKHTQNPLTKVKLACLIAIHKIDPYYSKKYSLEYLSHSTSILRNKSVELLYIYRDKEVLESARNIFQTGNYEQKKTILRLWHHMGGWSVIADLITAITDTNESIQNLAWIFLQKWKDKAVSLYTKGSQEEINQANENYRKFDKTKTKMTYYKEKLMEELPFFLQ